VAGKPPVAWISAPADGVQVEEGSMVALEGNGADLEDGVLADEVFAWSSDRDGALGRGRRIDVMTLSPGVHEITLQVADRDGRFATASITVEVVARPNTQPVADAGPAVTAAGRCSVLLDAGRSTDADGDPLITLWTLIAGPPGRRAWQSDPESRTTRFFADGPGDYEIELVVHDGQVASAADRLAVHVGGPSADRACLYLPLVLR
jgi:hypothetical protein